MTAGPDDHAPPEGGGPRRTEEAEVVPTRWPGWIWAVPLAVLGLVAWLAVRHVAGQGPEVTVSFASAEGIRAGETKVIYRGVEVGRVSDVQLAGDLDGVRLTLAMDPGVRDALRSGTRFWISGAVPSLVNLSSLKAVVAGPSIGMDPGGGAPTRHFVGLAAPPQVMSGTRGRAFILHADSLGGAAAGSTVSHLGLRVGTVEWTRFLGQGKGFDVKAFIRAPYDRLVRTNTRFWMAGAVRLSLGAGGVQAQLSPLTNLLSGAVDFDLPQGRKPGPRAQAGTRFPLYAGGEAAEAAPLGPQVPFRIRFSGPVGRLLPGAAVTLKGFRVGQVTGVALEVDAATGQIATPVSIEIEPERLTFTGAATGDRPKLVRQAFARLVARGLHARLGSAVPFIGPKEVVLVMEATPGDPPPASETGGVPEIPADRQAADADALMSQAQSLLAKFNALPIRRIGHDLADATRRLDALAASPRLKASLDHLDRTLARLDRISAEADRQAGPLLASLRQTAAAARQAMDTAQAVLGGPNAPQGRNLADALGELSRAGRAVRELADYLDRHPEALITGRRGP